MRGNDILTLLLTLGGLFKGKKAKLLAGAPDAVAARQAFVAAFRSGSSFTMDPGQVQRLGALMGLDAS